MTAAFSWLNDVMLTFVKSRMISGTVRPTRVADTTEDICVFTLVIRLTVPEIPEDCTVPVLISVEAPVFITVAWLSAVLAAVDRIVSMLVSEETPVLWTVAVDLIVLMPRVAVDSEPETCSHRLASVDTWALVEPVVAFDCAVLSSVASEVTPEVRALKEVAPESRVDCTVDRELSSDSAVDVLTEADRPVDWVVDRSVETLASADTLAETLDDTDTSPESAAETDSARVDAAVDVTLAEFRVLISEETPVEATVRRLVWVDTPEDALVS